MSDYHEPFEALSPEVRDAHRALASLKEEVEAIDWYHQRVALCQDPSLGDVLAHNRDEEMEHACMILEWLRRHMPGWDERLRAYLFKEGLIKDEDGSDDEAAPVGKGATDLGVGSLRPVEAAGREE
jgi:ferritin-like protein